MNSYNLFAYCGGDPVNGVDESGNVTISTGYSASFSPSGFVFSLQIGIVVDAEGNVEIQYTPPTEAVGVTTGTPGASFTRYKSVTSAPEIDDLLGLGYQMGGSLSAPVCGIPLCGSGDINIIPNNRGGAYWGLTKGLGIGTPGGKMHVEITNTREMRKRDLIFGIFLTRKSD